MNDDERHLHLLTIFHYVFGGIIAVLAHSLDVVVRISLM